MSIADGATLAGFSASITHLVANVGQAVVSVHSQRMVSTGFIWQPGLIITANEALAETGEIRVLGAKGEAIAQVVGRDPSTDIALLKVEGETGGPVQLEDVAPQVGSLALTLGAREGAVTAALGIVSWSGPAWRSMRGGTIDHRIELDVALRRSAEGGLAIDAAGQVLGMTVLGPRGKPLVIPAATIMRVAALLNEHGAIPRGYLGLGLQPISVPASGPAVMVISVDPAGPGAAAGLNQGDIVVALDGTPLQSLQSLLHALGPESVGRDLRLSMRRAGQSHDVQVSVRQRPVD